MYANQEQKQKALEAAKHENAKKLARIHVYQKYLRVLPCEANDKRISDIIDRWLGGNSDILHSLEIFEQAIAPHTGNPTEYSSLAKQREDITAEQLADEIINMLRTKGKAHDEFSLKGERAKLKFLNIPQLRERLANLQNAAVLASKSVSELKQMEADKHTDTRKFPGFPDLPLSIWDPEKSQHVTVDKEFLKALDGFSLKKYVRLYSAAQVNARLAQ